MPAELAITLLLMVGVCYWILFISPVKNIAKKLFRSFVRKYDPKE